MKPDRYYKAKIERLLIVKGISRSKLRDMTGFDIYRYLRKKEDGTYTGVSAAVKQLYIVFGWLDSLPDKE